VSVLSAVSWQQPQSRAAVVALAVSWSREPATWRRSARTSAPLPSATRTPEHARALRGRVERSGSVLRSVIPLIKEFHGRKKEFHGRSRGDLLRSVAAAPAALKTHPWPSTHPPASGACRSGPRGTASTSSGLH
jgi:hypothetical protein